MKINLNLSFETKESLRESRMQDECSKQESQQEKEKEQEQQKGKRRRRKGVINGQKEWKDILDQIHHDDDIHFDDISNSSSSSSSSIGFPKRKMDYYEAVYHPPTHRLESEMFFQKRDQKLSQTLMFSSCLRYVRKR